MEKGIFNNFYNYLKDYFENGHFKTAENEPALIIQRRAAAFQVFKEKGIPSNKDEEWKYTNLNRLLKDDYKFHSLESQFQKVSVDIEGLDACRVVLINGKFEPDLSHGLPEGVTFLDTRDVFANPQVADKIGTIADWEDNSMLAMNTAFFRDCYVLHVAAKTVITQPIHITHIYTDHADAAFIPYRLFTVAEKLSESTLIETFHSFTEKPVFVNYAVEQQVDEAAVFHTHMINTLGENIQFIHHREVQQFRNSVLNNSNISLGNAALTRNNLNFRLKESNTETNLIGTYIVSRKQHVDNHTIVDHQMPNCNSSELYKGILLDKAHGVFSGRIIVRPDAQKTNAFQQNKNLLLSDQATTDSKPQLEIFADDVKCSHGSTVGQVDKEALFYLKTRGIGEETASRLLVEAFVEDVHSQINIPALRDYVAGLLKEKLQAETLIIA